MTTPAPLLIDGKPIDELTPEERAAAIAAIPQAVIDELALAAAADFRARCHAVAAAAETGEAA